MKLIQKLQKRQNVEKMLNAAIFLEIHTESLN